MPTFDTLTFVGLERSHLRNAVYRRVFGDDAGPVRIGRYSILERIGSGARGVVFKAFDNQLDRLVALKVLSTRAGDHAELVREAKALARLSHPNVLSVYEVGETEEAQVFLATEYVKGWTLKGWFDEEHRSEAAIVDVMRQVALGVQAAHDEGLVHRDLKPANILVGNDARVRVADFGLARFDPTALEPTALEPGADIARDGFATTTAGTPGYMAPELFEGKPASAASDQYALAVTLGELIPTPRGPLAAALRRGLADVPEDRFPSVRAFADGLSARVGRSKRRGFAVGAALVGLGGVALLALPSAPTNTGDPRVALLEARAALPANPTAALAALEAADVDDDNALAIAERALALGPEDARWRLPEGARDSALLGELVVYRSATDALVVHDLSTSTPRRVDVGAIGLAEQAPEPLVAGLVQPPPMGIRMALGDARRLFEAAPRALAGFDSARRDLAVSKDGRRVARRDSATNTLVVEDSRSGEILWSLSLAGVSLGSVSLDDDGGRVGWTESGGAAYVHELDADTTFALDPAGAKILFPNAGESLILQGHYTGVFEVRLDDGRVTRLFDDDAHFLDVELSPSGTWLAALDTKGGIEVGRLDAWTTQRLEGEAFVFSPDGTRIATRQGPEVTLHELAALDSRRFTVPVAARDMDFASDDALWVLCADDELRRFPTSEGHLLEGHTAPISDIVLSRDGSRAVSLARDFTVRLWDVESGAGELVVKIDYSARHVGFDDRHEQIAIAGNQTPTHLYDLRGNALAELPHSYARPAANAAGEWFGAGEDGVWRFREGETATLEAGRCSGLLVSEAYVAAVCGRTPHAVHVWQRDRHQATTLSGSWMGGSLHAWPDDSHIALVGPDPVLVEIGDDGTLTQQPAPRTLIGVLEPWATAASSLAHDLLVTREEGITALWTVDTLGVRLAEPGSSHTLAVSGDGARFAFDRPNFAIIVRDRPISKGKRDLAAVLEAHAVVEGEL